MMQKRCAQYVHVRVMGTYICDCKNYAINYIQIVKRIKMPLRIVASSRLLAGCNIGNMLALSVSLSLVFQAARTPQNAYYPLCRLYGRWTVLLYVGGSNARTYNIDQFQVVQHARTCDAICKRATSEGAHTSTLVPQVTRRLRAVAPHRRKWHPPSSTTQKQVNGMAASPSRIHLSRHTRFNHFANELSLYKPNERIFFRSIIIFLKVHLFRPFDGHVKSPVAINKLWYLNHECRSKTCFDIYRHELSKPRQTLTVIQKNTHELKLLISRATKNKPLY